jgi:hypothetical protein
MASNIPIAQAGNSATNVAVRLPAVGNDLQNEKAWKEALDLCSKSTNLSWAKDLFRSTSPNDIRKYLEDVQQQQRKSKLSKTMRGIGTCIDALVRHEKAMEMFAQAGGMPGCVAWGSIRLVLGVCVSPTFHTINNITPILFTFNTFFSNYSFSDNFHS